MKIKDIKKQGLKMLTENWGQAAAAILVILVIYVIIATGEKSLLKYLVYKGFAKDSEITLITRNKYIILANVLRSFIGFIVITPAYMGAIWWYLRYVRGEKNNVGSIFVCYSNINIFLKTLEIKAIVGLIKLIAFLPVAALIILEKKLIDSALISVGNNSSTVILIACCGLLIICGACMYILFVLKYTLVDYFFVLNPDQKISYIIKSSVKKMKDNRTIIIKLFLSFLWWVPSFILVFPALFAVPYYAMSFTVMINGIIEDDFLTEQKVYKREKVLSVT